MASPSPGSQAFGVLIGPASGGSYSVSIVGASGLVSATTTVTAPSWPSCGGHLAFAPAPVSTSASRLYYMDGSGDVRWIAPGGQQSSAPVIRLPIGSSRRSVFAVAPDDSEIAVAVEDFSPSATVTRLFIDQLPGGKQTEIFSETSNRSVWPIGWRGKTSLVVGKAYTCGDIDLMACCELQELHVVDPRTATRLVTLGNTDGCQIDGAATPGGVACEDLPYYANVRVVDWSGHITRSFSNEAGQIAAYVSPDGRMLAVQQPQDPVPDTVILETRQSFLSFMACGWVDDLHLLGDYQGSPAVADLASGKINVISAAGTCGGRIPGGL
jgi:hypothetical protein